MFKKWYKNLGDDEVKGHPKNKSDQAQFVLLKFKNGKIGNVIVDKNTDRNRDLPSILSDVKTKNGRILVD